MKIVSRSALWSILAGMLLLANLELAHAHRWWKWHWNKAGIGAWNTAVRHDEAQAALNDWGSHTEINFSMKSSHTDISVFDGNYGATGWSGLATIKDSEWDWWCWWWCGVDHGHARVNTYYAGNPSGFSNNIQGIFCQEIGHLFGLGHSDNGCMGKGYYNNLNTSVSHNWSDVNAYTH